MAPVVRALSSRRTLSHQLLLTGQHRDLRAMFDGAGDVVELAYDPSGRTPAKLRESLHRLLCGRFQRQRPDLVLVHGDTASAFAGALAARDCGIPIGHVEAGLRSFDVKHPWPEEGNRIAIDALSALLFAPTARAAENLHREWRVKGEIHVTGNSGIDALLDQAAKCPPGSAGAAEPTILVTCHRKENEGAARAAIASALKRLVRHLPVRIVLPLHPNRHIRAETEHLLGGTPHIALLPPLDHAQMVATITRSWLILTDSGGLQEEGPALGKPVLVLREVTERPEAAPNVELVGSDPDRIFAAVAGLILEPGRYAAMACPNLAFGDGKAGPRIAAACQAFLRARAGRLRARA